MDNCQVAGKITQKAGENVLLCIAQQDRTLSSWLTVKFKQELFNTERFTLHPITLSLGRGLLFFFFVAWLFFWWSGSSTGECFAIPSSAAQHCCRRCNPMNLLQILAAAFNALHFTKHRKSQLEAAKAKRKEKSAPNN